MRHLFFILLLIPIVSYCQCPDGKSNQYKQKAQKYGETSYSTLAVYYYYKCQCENGIANRTPAQVNKLVDQYNRLKANRAGSSNGISLPNQHQVQWVTINKVSKCSKAKSNTSNKENTNGIKNNKETEIEREPFFTKDFLEENIINLIKGDTDLALKNISNEIQVKNLMNNSGLDRQTAQGVTTLVTTLGSELDKILNRPKTPEELKIKFEKKFAKKGSSSYFANDSLVIISSSKYGTKTVSYTKNGIGRTSIYNKENIIIRDIRTKSIILSQNNTIDKIVMVETDYEKDTKEEFTINGDYDIIKHINLITDEVIVDFTNATKTEEDILDEKGKKIGVKTLMDGKLFKTSIPDKKKKTIKETSYHLGKKKRSQISEVKFKTIKIPIEIIEYDELENIKKKVIFNIEKKKATLTETYYENGQAVREVKKVNGEVVSDNTFD